MKKEISPKIISLIFGILVICFTAGFYVFAASWTEPSVDPPGGDIDVPINIGTDEQVKSGRLGIQAGDADDNYGLTVGDNANIVGVKAKGDSYFESNITIMGDIIPNAGACADGQVLKKSAGVWTCDAYGGGGSGDITEVVESGSTPLTFTGCDTGSCAIGMNTDGSGDCSAGYACTGGHTHSQYLTSETDPQVGTINVIGQWCRTDGNQINCDQSPPGGSAPDVFRTINATSGTDPVADSSTDTLNLSAGSGITVSGNSTTDTVTIGYNSSTIQTRVSGTCAVGNAIRTINSNGTVVCESVGGSGGDDDWKLIGGGDPTLAGDIYHSGRIAVGADSFDANYEITTTGGGVKAESTNQPAGYFSSTTGYGLLVNSGNVGIGVLNPSVKLDVNGTIDASDFTENGSNTLSNDISGDADTVDTFHASQLCKSDGTDCPSDTSTGQHSLTCISFYLSSVAGWHVANIPNQCQYGICIYIMETTGALNDTRQILVRDVRHDYAGAGQSGTLRYQLLENWAWASVAVRAVNGDSTASRYLQFGEASAFDDDSVVETSPTQLSVWHNFGYTVELWACYE